jgi:hypothetical protein
MLTHALELVTGGWRYIRGLRGYLAVTLTQAEAEEQLRQALNHREEAFLDIMERAVLVDPGNPYHRLLRHAGFTPEDVRALVRAQGLEGGLAALHAAGVYVTLDEFKGRAPVRREGLEFDVSDRDFDNPLLTEHALGATSGSRGGGSRLALDFDFIGYDALGSMCALIANGVLDRPVVIGQASPPSVHGLKTMLRMARMGRMPAKWFSSSKPLWNRQGIQGRLLTLYTVISSRLFGRPIPRPQHPDSRGIVAYLARMARRGTPALMYAVPSQAVRICLAAEEAGADIRGTAFFGGGEPYTEGKEAVLQRVGAIGMPSYGMNEIGLLCYRCGSPAYSDDMHFMLDKAAVLQRPLRLASGMNVDALYHTSISASTPKLMLNVESGDYGVLEQRDCGCLLQRVGYTTHLHSVRSYEKLTSEGVMFMGSMLYELLDEKLPARFGGSATDYQLVEEEEDGLPRVSILISPRIGPVDEAAVKQALIESVGFADWSRRMADQWLKAGTLRVQRREPHQTISSKILPLHVLRGTSPVPAAREPVEKPETRRP